MKFSVKSQTENLVVTVSMRDIIFSAVDVELTIEKYQNSI